MGNSSSISLQKEEIDEISLETGFSANQIDRLYSRFTSLDKEAKGHLSRDDFLRIPELAINPLGDRIINAFFYESREGNEKVNFPDFVRVLAHFRPIEEKKEDLEADSGGMMLNSRREKINFAFRMYDINGDDMVTKAEVLAVLEMMVGSNINDEQLESIAQRIFTEADKDKDGLISLEEFTKSLEKSDIEQKMSIKFLDQSDIEQKMSIKFLDQWDIEQKMSIKFLDQRDIEQKMSIKFLDQSDIEQKMSIKFLD